MIDNDIKVYHRLGHTEDGKAIYEVKDDYTQKYKKYTVPEENADKYEKFCDSLANSSLRGFTSDKFIRKIGISGGAGALAGTGIALLLTKKSKVSKKVLGGLSGAILGGIVGAIGYLAYFVNKVGKVLSEAKKLGIEDYKEPTLEQPQVSEQPKVKPVEQKPEVKDDKKVKQTKQSEQLEETENQDLKENSKDTETTQQ